jgi:hypothetical protein
MHHIEEIELASESFVQDILDDGYIILREIDNLAKILTGGATTCRISASNALANWRV